MSKFDQQQYNNAEFVVKGEYSSFYNIDNLLEMRGQVSIPCWKSMKLALALSECRAVASWYGQIKYLI